MEKLEWLSGDDLDIWYCLGYIDKGLFLELWKKDPNAAINWDIWELEKVAAIERVTYGYMHKADEDEGHSEYDDYYYFYKQNKVTEADIKSGYYTQVTYLLID